MFAWCQFMFENSQRKFGSKNSFPWKECVLQMKANPIFNFSLIFQHTAQCSVYYFCEKKYIEAESGLANTAIRV